VKGGFQSSVFIYPKGWSSHEGDHGVDENRYLKTAEHDKKEKIVRHLYKLFIHQSTLAKNKKELSRQKE
jgi:hypothetical protein